MNGVNNFPNSSRPSEMHMSQAGWKGQYRCKVVFVVIFFRLEIGHPSAYRSGIGSKPIKGQIKAMTAVIHGDPSAAVATFAPPMGVPFCDALRMRVSVSIQRHGTHFADSTALNDLANRLDHRRMFMIVTGKNHSLNMFCVIQKRTSFFCCTGERLFT